MYITINDIIGEKTIDLSYPIRSIAGRGKEIVVISMLSENTQYEMTKSLNLKLVDGSKVNILQFSHVNLKVSHNYTEL